MKKDQSYLDQRRRDYREKLRLFRQKNLETNDPEKAKFREDLMGIFGISDKISKTIMDQYSTSTSIKNATVKQLMDISGVGEGIARALKARFS